ncbi:hypothetical protein ACJJTC_007777 [Scirpophaga incertulas]
MASTQKMQKNKPHAPSPRLVPRPTAASAARAARVSLNRNLPLLTQPHRQTPNRGSNVSTPAKTKTCSINKSSRNNSKYDLIIPPQEPDACVVDHLVIPDEKVSPLTTATDDNNTNEILLEDITIEVESSEIESDNDNLPNVICDNKPVIDKEPAGSQPQTPVHSRPQTPKSQQSSRPQTPKGLNNRPMTPVHACYTTPVSRPSTPQSQHSSKANTLAKANVESVSVKKTHSGPLKPTNDEEEDIKTVYSSMQQLFQNMKKELDMKQQAVLAMFNNLRDLRERMCQEGNPASGEGLHPQELMVFNVGDWAVEEIAQLCRDAAASAATDGAADIIKNIGPFDEHAFVEINTNVTNVQELFANLCLQAFTTRQEIIDWVKGLLESNENNSEIFGRIEQFNSEGLKLHESLQELIKCANSTIESLSQLSRRAYQERKILIAVGESLLREIASLRQDLDARITATEMNKSIRKTINH